MKILKPILAALLFIIVISPARSQWVPCQGIEGTYCSSIVQQDSFLFIDGSGGIFRRNIEDTKWDTACLKGGFMKICSTGNALFCLGGNTMSSFYRSLDNGFTWELLDLEYSYRDFKNVDSILFINTYYDGLIRTSDNGESWTEVDPSTNSAEINCIYSQQGTLFCLFESVDTLFQSDDYGYSWTTYCLQNITEGHPYLYDENLWLASENHFYIYNAGTSEWLIQSDSLPNQVYWVNFIEDTESLCCYTNDGYFCFNFQDSVWEDLSLGLENRYCHDACRVDSTIFMATPIGPVSKTGNEQWIPQDDDLFGFPVSQVFVLGSKTYALSNGKIYFSDDIVDGFISMETQDYCSPNQMIFTNTAWYLGSNCGFSISVDSGQTWTAHNEGMEGHKFFQIAIGGNYYFAEISQPGGHGLARSRTDSIAWQFLPNEFGNTYFHDIDVINDVLFVIKGSDGGIYKSIDNGTTFESIPEAGYENASLFVKNNKIFKLRNFDEVIYSADLGVTWQAWISGVDVYVITCMDITDTEETTVLSGFTGFWDTQNYFTLFSPEYPSGIDILSNIPSYCSGDILFDNGRIFACPSSGGLWYRDDLAVGIKENEPSVPQSYSQLAIYPNPAKDIIKIHLDKNIELAEYQVVDYSGKMMMNGKIEKGLSDYSINVSCLADGIYLIIIRNDDDLLSGKFIKAN